MRLICPSEYTDLRKITMLFILLISVVYQVFPAGDNPNQMSDISAGDSIRNLDVTFEFDDDIICGFTIDSQNLDDETLEAPAFVAASDESGTPYQFQIKPGQDDIYSTDEFYYYVQILSNNKVRIDYTISPLAAGADSIPCTVSIKRNDQTAATDISIGSSEVSSINKTPLLELSTDVPRIHWWSFRVHFTKADFFKSERLSPVYNSTIKIIVDGGDI